VKFLAALYGRQVAENACPWTFSANNTKSVVFVLLRIPNMHALEA